MANTFKNKETPSGTKSSIFSWINGLFNVDKIFADGLPVQYFPKIFFFTCIAIFYIANGHYSEKSVRKINKLQQEVEDLRADYITMKADMMLAGKQSEVAKKVAPLGLKESMEPPFKVTLE